MDSTPALHQNGDTYIPKDCACVSSVAKNFSYYEPILFEDAQDGFVEHRVQPINGPRCDPYCFPMHPQGDTFLDMNSIYMQVTVSMTCSKSRAELLTWEADNPSYCVSPANNTLNALWSSIECYLNDEPIGPASFYNAHYKSFIENVLSYDSKKNTHLGATNFHFNDDIEKDKKFTDRDTAHFALRKMFHHEWTAELCGPVCVDFLRANNHLAPGNKLELRFNQTNDKFLWNSRKPEFAYRSSIKDISLYYRRIRMYPERFRSLFDYTKPQIYCTSHTQVRLFPLTQNITHWDITLSTENAPLPKQIVVGFVSTKAQLGTYEKDGFYFEPFGINHIVLKKNGTRIPSEPLQPNFTTKETSRSYYNLFMNTGRAKLNVGNTVSKKHFDSAGLTLFPLDLSNDGSNGHHFQAGKNGKLELKLRWETPLTELVTCVVYFANDMIVKLPFSGGKPEIAIF